MNRKAFVRVHAFGQVLLRGLNRFAMNQNGPCAADKADWALEICCYPDCVVAVRQASPQAFAWREITCEPFRITVPRGHSVNVIRFEPRSSPDGDELHISFSTVLEEELIESERTARPAS